MKWRGHSKRPHTILLFFVALLMPLFMHQVGFFPPHENNWYAVATIFIFSLPMNSNM